eukprot:Unigene3554_Nuclearia_a/m.10850 Unigene3554_Nuclearia_a/g.10850  ORF Unigene3554_Nuclearia_a/g.10850 Unigene3554_Nuclearia_a/m.10850 type:complete len:175 (-) Unigene3554_Nuclearia_a:68-592(-)
MPDGGDALLQLQHPVFVAARDGDAAALARLLGDIVPPTIKPPLPGADEDGDAPASSPPPPRPTMPVPDDATAAARGWTPLHVAIEGGHDACVQVLIEHCADVNARDADDDTPLHYAAYWGHTACVGWLLAANAHIEPQNKYQWSPLDVAVRRGKDEVAALLQDEQRHRAALGML